MATVHPLLAVRLLDVRKSRRFVPSVWDAVIFALVIGGLALIAVGGRQTLQPLAHSPPISLDPGVLPNYALRTPRRG